MLSCLQNRICMNAECCVCDGNYSSPGGYRAGCITLLPLLASTSLISRSFTYSHQSLATVFLPPRAHLSLSPLPLPPPLNTKTRALSLSLSPPSCLARARVAACLESVLHSYARRAQAGGVTVSQQKHLIPSASQRLTCSHRASALYCHPAYITALAPDPHTIIPFSPPTRRSFGALPCTVVADPVRRPSTAIRPLSFSLPQPKLLPPPATKPLTYPLTGLEPGTDPTAALRT